ncbi:(Na+)-NQR maturation NqrM [Shewanella gelidii]|uniref:(Na+)-NQR maturation NqrM n=1 Tax=Shewanella gelidii TaxID=1642821 RepID=A0A917NA76_9GAMM|nr:(Na+)-NQR maturation NqrM [Shewanella gelidii]MCL1099459.1 (Na+)-NQR maturation NqrM [Shewanella gelidii]GGI77173.1 hypothetical protein GCM10009332_13100 [Shewanella gelidii]
MAEFFVTFGLLITTVLLMSVGYIVKRRSINGSCGGLASVGVDKVCNCPEPCSKRKARMAVESTLGKRVTKATVAKSAIASSKKSHRMYHKRIL